MNITLLGATGKTGTEILKQAIVQKNKVKAIVRTPSKIIIEDPNLAVIKGDVTDVKVLSSAFKGSDIVLSTLGSMKDTKLMTKATKAIISAAKSTGVKKVIIMSTFAVNRNQMKIFTKLITSLLMKDVIADKTSAEAILRSSNLDWTIVYATALSNKDKKGHVKVINPSVKLGINNKITRADVAAWILEESKNPMYVRKDVVITQ